MHHPRQRYFITVMPRTCTYGYPWSCSTIIIIESAGPTSIYDPLFMIMLSSITIQPLPVCQPSVSSGGWLSTVDPRQRLSTIEHQSHPLDQPPDLISTAVNPIINGTITSHGCWPIISIEINRSTTIFTIRRGSPKSINQPHELVDWSKDIGMMNCLMTVTVAVA